MIDNGWKEQYCNMGEWSLSENGSEDFIDDGIRFHIQCELIILLQED